jgi:hypothetical protein
MYEESFPRPTTAASLESPSIPTRERNGRCLHNVELAFQDARENRVDQWIRAACDRLHEAVVAHIVAVETAAGSV